MNNIRISYDGHGKTQYQEYREVDMENAMESEDTISESTPIYFKPNSSEGRDLLSQFNSFVELKRNKRLEMIFRFEE